MFLSKRRIRPNLKQHFFLSIGLFSMVGFSPVWSMPSSRPAASKPSSLSAKTPAPPTTRPRSETSTISRPAIAQKPAFAGRSDAFKTTASRPAIAQKAATTQPIRSINPRSSQETVDETPLLPSDSPIRRKLISSLELTNKVVLLNRHLVLHLRDNTTVGLTTMFLIRRIIPEYLAKNKTRCHRIKKYNADIRCDQLELLFDPQTPFRWAYALMHLAAKSGFSSLYLAVGPKHPTRFPRGRWIPLAPPKKPKKALIRKYRPRATLQLTVWITSQGYNIRTRGMILPRGCDLSSQSIRDPNKQIYPTLFATKDRYPYHDLRKCLLKIRDLFPEKQPIYITADPQIPYQTILETIESSRDPSGQLYFPKIVFFSRTAFLE